jgi:hypothetical protein
MSNNRGSVILLIMLLLGVVTLVAVGAMVMSIYDQKFTSALKSYDKGFNLADGAATLSFRDLGQRDREQDTSFIDPNSPPGPIIIFCHCQDSSYTVTGNVESGNCISARSTCTRCVDRSVGNFDSKIQLLGFSTQPPPGWEAGTYYAEQWNGTGQAAPATTLVSGSDKQVNTAYSAMVETSVNKTKAR